MRLFYAGDIHGSDRCFKKFINAGGFYHADVLVLGGDLTAKMVIPVVDRGGGKHEARLFGATEVAETPEEIEDLEQRIAANGFYPYRCTPDELAEAETSTENQANLFRRLIVGTLERWLALAEERLANTDIQCYIMPGNDDDPAVCDVLRQGNRVVNPEFKNVQLPGGFEMVSVGFSNKTPFDSPREMDEDALGTEIEALAGSVRNMSTAIFNFHCPPYDSGLDLAPKVTADLRMVTRGGQPVMVPVGSTSVRKAIEQHQPLLGLHGHVHESRGATKIGRTLCLNPGSDYAAGVLRGLIIDLGIQGIVSHQFVSG